MTFLRKLKRPEGRELGGRQVHDVTFASSYPALFEYMTSCLGPDKKPRKTASLTIFQDQGMLKAFLNEKESGAYLCVSSESLAGVLASLEGLLAAEDCPWRWSDLDAKRDGKKKGPGA